jgi:hypothetical protein
MQTVKQLSVSLVNKPGRLAATLAALQKERVNLLALTVTEAGDRGTLRFVPDDAEQAAKALDDLNVRYDSADVLLVEMPNQPGAFAKVCERLAVEHLNIDYAYTSASPKSKAKGGAMAVVKVNDLVKAGRALAGDAANGHRNGKLPVRRPVRARKPAAKWTARSAD